MDLDRWKNSYIFEGSGLNIRFEAVGYLASVEIGVDVHIGVSQNAQTPDKGRIKEDFFEKFPHFYVEKSLRPRFLDLVAVNDVVSVLQIKITTGNLRLFLSE